ncbi:hypothetical protein D3C75_909450 [compost metagenome]
MGYYYRGFISSGDIINSFKQKYDNITAIKLYDDFVTIPLSDELYDEINQTTSTPVSGFEYLTDEIGVICISLSEQSQIAYVEAEYFGGLGSQSGIIWEKNNTIFCEAVTDNAINRVLNILGIQKIQNKDEFDTVALGRHRNIEDWINKEPHM